MKSLIVAYQILVLMIITLGCSNSGNSSVSPNIPNSQMLAVNQNYSMFELFNEYSLSISSDGTAELTPTRTSSLGESFIVSGLPYFMITPCPDCLRLKGLSFDSDKNISIDLSIKHPFPKGDPGEGPSATNRLDLDIFDLALVFAPELTIEETAPHDYLLTKLPPNYPGAYTGIILNADGYTLDLLYSYILGCAPYKICYENSNNNRFEMGTNWQDFSVLISKKTFYFRPSPLRFKLYLTMGYGASAKKPERLDPTYYVPEFNRKPAWKVVVPPVTWTDDAPSTVTIDVYDWNHGATIADSFPDTDNTDHIFAQSDIETVTVEVLYMTSTLVEATTTDTSSNGWDDPLTYTASFSNENGLRAGDYIGLVKVTDSRSPSTTFEGGETDTIVYTDDGIELKWMILPEFATYQAFSANIEKSGVGSNSVVTWGGTCPDSDTHVTVANSGNIYVTGQYECTIDLDPGPGEDLHTSGTPYQECSSPFLSKFDSNLNFIWGKSWGGIEQCIPLSIGVDVFENIWVGGVFNGIVDFDPGPGEENHQAYSSDWAFISVIDSNGDFVSVGTWGPIGGTNVGSNNVKGICFDDSGYIYYTGEITGANIDLDPGNGMDIHSSHNCSETGTTMFCPDAYLAKLDLNGNFQWAIQWGEYTHEYCVDVEYDNSGHVYVTGDATGIIDLDPGAGEDLHESFSDNLFDIFLSMFDLDGNYQWGHMFGGPLSEHSEDLSADAFGNVYVTGVFEESVDFDPGAGVDLHMSNGEKDVFVASFDWNGTFRWANTWGTAHGEGDFPQAVITDSSGNVYNTGWFRQYADLDPSAGVDMHATGQYGGMFLTKYDTNGTFLWAESLGGEYGAVLGNSLVFDNSSNLLIGGIFRRTPDFEQGNGVNEITSHGQEDCFLMKFSE